MLLMLSVTLYTIHMVIIGHRGACGLAPENTLKSLEKCLEYQPRGVSMVEFDVRVTHDKIPVLHHDRHLKDASGNRLDVRKHTFAELKEHKADLATLDEALRLIKARLITYIEIKPGEQIKPIADVLKKYLYKTYKDRVYVGSKSQKTLLEIHELFPKIPTIVIEPWSGIRATYRARHLDTKLICMNERWLWFGLIRAITNSGYTLYTYTLNDTKKARQWQRHGLAGVVTDYPDLYASK